VKKEGFYVVGRDGEDYVVTKVHEGVPEAEYRIHNGMCSCSGFKYNHDCKHVEMLVGGLESRAVELAEARKIVTGLVSSLSVLFERVEFPTEIYERDDTGRIWRITLLLKRALSPTLMKPGVWEGCLKDSHLKVKLVISS